MFSRATAYLGQAQTLVSHFITAIQIMPFVQKVMNMMIYMVYIWYSNLYAKRSYFRMKFSYAYIEILPVIEEEQ